MGRRRNKSTTNLAFDAGRLFWEAGSVMGLRMAMMAWDTAPKGEARRMVEEKPTAFANAAFDAAEAAGRAMLRAPFDATAMTLAASSAWTRTLAGTARGNRRRLTRRPARKT